MAETFRLRIYNKLPRWRPFLKLTASLSRKITCLEDETAENRTVAWACCQGLRYFAQHSWFSGFLVGFTSKNTLEILHFETFPKTEVDGSQMIFRISSGVIFYLVNQRFIFRAFFFSRGLMGTLGSPDVS